MDIAILIGVGILGTLIGIAFHKIASASKPVPVPEPEEDDVEEFEQGEEQEPEPPNPEPLPTGTYNLSEFKRLEDKVYYGLTFHTYDLGAKYRLDRFDLTLDMVDNWHGINQVLFYMSNTPTPNTGFDEISWARQSAKSTNNPWKYDVDITKLTVPEYVKFQVTVRSGRYFTIGFTNKHQFTDEGEITIHLKARQ